jgi:hypothetical protein
MSTRPPRAVAGALLLLPLLAACGTSPSAPSSSSADQTTGDLIISPQNSDVVVGVDRLGIAILTKDKKPVDGATATLQIQGANGTFETRPLEWIGKGYGTIPVYLATARLPQTGQYRFVVEATLADGTRDSGSAMVNVSDKSAELPVGYNLRQVKADLHQPILGDPGVTIETIDTGVPPDGFHTATIQHGLDQHKPMVIYLGEPGRCVSQTCGPTVQVLEQIYPQYQDTMLFEHVEVHYPAQANTYSPIYAAFGLQSEPWVYFVNAQGVVSDRFEGFVTADELRTAADGTLAGRVPAVDLPIS